MGYFKGLDGDLVAGGIEAGTRPFGRPSFAKIPANFLFARVIVEHYGAAFPFDFAVHGFFTPVPQFGIIGRSPFEADVGIFIQTGKLTRSQPFGTFAVFDRVLGRIKPGTLTKSRPGYSVKWRSCRINF